MEMQSKLLGLLSKSFTPFGREFPVRSQALTVCVGLALHCGVM
jgi:hypothetical protein